MVHQIDRIEGIVDAVLVQHLKEKFIRKYFSVSQKGLSLLLTVYIYFIVMIEVVPFRLYPSVEEIGARHLMSRIDGLTIETTIDVHLSMSATDEVLIFDHLNLEVIDLFTIVLLKISTDRIMKIERWIDIDHIHLFIIEKIGEMLMREEIEIGEIETFHQRMNVEDRENVTTEGEEIIEDK